MHDFGHTFGFFKSRSSNSPNFALKYICGMQKPINLYFSPQVIMLGALIEHCLPEFEPAESSSKRTRTKWLIDDVKTVLNMRYKNEASIA